MASLNENAEIVRTTARQFRAIIELAEQLDPAKADQEIKDKQASVKAMDEHLARALEDVKAAQLAGHKAKVSGDAYYMAAQEKAAAVKALAEKEASDVKAQADVYAAQVAGNLKIGKAKLAELHASIAALDKQLADKETALAVLKAEMASLAAKLGG